MALRNASDLEIALTKMREGFNALMARRYPSPLSLSRTVSSHETSDFPSLVPTLSTQPRAFGDRGREYNEDRKTDDKHRQDQLGKPTPLTSVRQFFARWRW